MGAVVTAAEEATGSWGPGIDPSSWPVVVLPSRSRPDVHPEVLAARAEGDGVAAATAEALRLQEDQAPPRRHLTTRRLSTVTMKAVRWVWKERIPRGSLVLLVGREGIGKSTVAYDLAASITRGVLPGDDYGKPRSVVVVATEDSLESTVAPRLAAARADMDRVLIVEAITEDGMTEDLQLPVDIADLAALVRAEDVGLVILDPLTSRLAGQLDTHKDADVRKALEPLTAFCEASGSAVIGLMHVNKGGSGDPGTSIMGSRAFPAVARAVLYVQVDEDAENEHDHPQAILEVVKANLGPKGKDNLAYEIEEVQVGYDYEEDLPVLSSRIHWLGNTDKNVRDAMAASNDSLNDKDTITGAALWLKGYMETQGGEVESMDVKKAGAGAGYSESALKRAKKKVGIEYAYKGYPKRSYWTMALDTQSDAYVATSDRKDGTAVEVSGPEQLEVGQ